MLVVQAALGIWTALWAAPLHLAITHQIGAVVLWVLVLRARHLATLSRSGVDPGGDGMSNNTSFRDLVAFQRQTEALAGVAGRLGWDQETMMPRGAAEQRGEEMAAMEGILHARRTDPRVGEWLEAADPASDYERRYLQLVRRSFDRATKVPGDLAQEIARVTSVAQGVWAEARAAEKVADFLPTLAHVIRLRRLEAECLAQGGDLYDALIDDYEPGASADSAGRDVRADAAPAGGLAGGGAGNGASAGGRGAFP